MQNGTYLNVTYDLAFSFLVCHSSARREALRLGFPPPFGPRSGIYDRGMLDAMSWFSFL